MTQPDYTIEHHGPNLERASFGDLVALGHVPGTSVHHVIGRNPDINGTAADAWTKGGIYTFSDVATAYYASSSNAGDTQVIGLAGLGDEYESQEGTVTLDGQTPVQIPGSWLRLNQALNLGSVDLLGDVHIYESDTVVAGVPQTQGKIRGHIRADYQQTSMAIYTTPARCRGLITGIWVGGNVADIVATTAGDITIMARRTGGVFRVIIPVGWHSNGGGIYIPVRPSSLVLPGTDIVARCDAASPNLDVTVGFSLMCFSY